MTHKPSGQYSSRSSNINSRRFETCIQKMDEKLSRYPFRQKMYELTNSHVFHFDIYKVINDRNCQLVAKLCYKFYFFLAAKMVMRVWEHCQKNCQNLSKKQIWNDQIISDAKLEHKSKKSKECSNPRKPNSQNRIKARATTLTSSNSNQSITLRKQKKYSNKSSEKKMTIESEIVSQIQISEENQLINAIVNSCSEIKQAYCLLTETINNRKRVQKLQIISFLIALLAPFMLAFVVEFVEKELGCKLGCQDNQLHIEAQQDQKQSKASYIQQQIYIILTFQTLGSLISNSVFTCLKKKYIKQQIFVTEGNIGFYKLARSLKFIKDRLTHKDVIMVKDRRQRNADIEKLIKRNSLKLNDANQFTVDRMKKFIKQALRVKEQLDFATTSEVKPFVKEAENINSKLQQSIYPSSLNRNSVKLSMVKQSPVNKCSISIKTKLNLESIKFRKTDESKKKHYVKDYQKTFYKIKNVVQKNPSAKIIKSERNTYKFSKLSFAKSNALLFNSNAKQDKYKQEPIQLIKIKLKTFKQSALQDKQNIDLFKPFKSRQGANRQSFQNHSANIEYSPSESFKRILKQRENKPKGFKIKFPSNQKEQVWHEMYNIRESMQGRKTNKTLESQKCEFKLTKTSQKLKKDKIKFMEDCKMRNIYLEEDDVDLVDRIKTRAY